MTVPTVTAGLTQLLLDLGAVFTDVIGYITNVTALFTTEPILLVSVGFVFVGFIIGIFGRILRRH